MVTQGIPVTPPPPLPAGALRRVPPLATAAADALTLARAEQGRAETGGSGLRGGGRAGPADLPPFTGSARRRQGG